MERKIAALWSRLLQQPMSGIDDNFFDLGGHSLLLAQMQVELRQTMHVDIELIDLFNHPTIRALANYIAGGRSEMPQRAALDTRAAKQKATMAQMKKARSRNQSDERPPRKS
jgi:acyl carrier protein